MRRWIAAGTIDSTEDDSGRMVVDGRDLARLARERFDRVPEPEGGSSARNRFVGLVTNVLTDTVMAQVDLQCGPYRVVSLMSSEAARDLGLEPGSIAVAVIKSTTVVIENLKEIP